MLPLSAPRAPLTRRSVLGGAAVAVGAALTGACGGGAQRGAAPTAAPLVLTDQRGDLVHLDQPARRIVTIPMPAAAMLVAVDQGASHLAGVQNSSWVAMRDGILGEFFPEALRLPHAVADNTFVPNVEGVLALQPDLVVQWGDSGAGITAPLENAGLKVLGLRYGSQRDVETWISLFASALGKPDRATLLLASIHTALQEMTTLGQQAPGPPPSILYLNRFVGGLKVAGRGSYNDFYISLVGGQNPATGPKGIAGAGMVGVEAEQVLAWDPDIVLLGNFDAAMPADLYATKAFRGLSAVRHRRVYKVPLGGYRWDPPSHESPLMWRWLSMVAFPDTARRFDLRAEVTTSYRRFYDRVPTPAQLDTLLWTEANADSAHYEQFRAA